MNIKGSFHRIAHLLPFILFGVAAFIVHHEIKVHNINDIISAVHAIPVFVLASAFILTILNYLVLAGYDVLALRYTGHDVPLFKVVLTSLFGYSISNNTGHAWASGGSVRYRFYSKWGVPGWDIVKISLFLGLTYIIGVVTMGAIGTALIPADVQGQIENPMLITWMGLACGACLIVYWAAIFFWKKPISFKSLSFTLPSPKIAMAQTIIACFDMVLASLVLWVLLAGRVDMSFETFLVIFVLAQVAGLFSQVPGGIGVFEGAFLWLIGPAFASAHLEIVSALVLYRIVYYFMPLGLAGIGMVLYETISRREHFITAGGYISQGLSSIIPHLFSILLFIAGGILLVSGATPSVPENVAWLREIIPLPLIEFSHLIGSFIGVLLLFLARGIRLRIDAAWYGSIALLAIGVLVSLLKGLDWEEASILSAMLLLILPTKRYFRRSSSLFNMSFTPQWILMIAAMVGGAIWLGFFSFRHVEYTDNLWWQFSYKDDAPRFLRSMVVMAGAVIFYALWRVTAVAKQVKLILPEKSDIENAQILALKGNDTQGFLSLLGDKYFLWSATKQSFIMYAPTSKYWIAMGDPVGDKQEFEDLLWKFREDADKAGAKAVFYQVSKENLPNYMDIGLVMLKMGEEARIPLKDFTLEGKKREGLRGGRNKLTKLNYSFEILEYQGVADNFTRLKEISDLWCAKKNAHEKGFSLGFFEENYIKRTRVCVVRNAQGEIMAFANLWELENHHEISIDLMRYDPESPSGIMDYLFAELMLWASAEGFEWFSIGMAPLAGLERHPLAPLWHKVGTVIYDLGEEFYNFEGLYKYKAKFEPEWKPRYLAVPPGLSAPAVLLRTTALISGGWKGIFKR